jgi:hypothetical protein
MIVPFVLIRATKTPSYKIRANGLLSSMFVHKNCCFVVEDDLDDGEAAGEGVGEIDNDLSTLLS